MIFAFALLAAAAGVQAQSNVLSPTPVLVRPVERGSILSAGDFVMEDRSAGAARGGIGPEAAAGLEATRRLSQGAVVRSGDVVQPRLVRRGEPVTIHVRSGGLSIVTSGRALADGRLGDVVRVVASTNRTLDGVVEGTAAVRIAAP